MRIRLIALLFLAAAARADFREFTDVAKDPSLETKLRMAAEATLKAYPKLKADDIALTLVDVTNPSTVSRGDHHGDVPFYPASVIKLFFMVDVYATHKEKIGDVDRALKEMIVVSDNDATAYLVDLLAGTVPGPPLEGRALRRYIERRRDINRRFQRLGYTDNVSAMMKPWSFGPFGVDLQVLGENRENRNKLTSNATASLLLWIVRRRAPGSHEMMKLLERPLAPRREEENQVKEFIGEALPTGALLWSKAGWTSEVRHDAAYIELPSGKKMILVIFTRGIADDVTLIPAITRNVLAELTTRMVPEADIDKLFADYSGDVPGAAVVVTRDGEVVFRKSYGLADVEKHAPVTPASNFRLASVTKQFVAAGITILADRGTLSYDDPIARWLPSLPPATKAITIRQLLTHTSGLVDYEDLIPESQTEQVLDPDVLRLLEGADRTLFAPGEKYQYSNSGYVLLGSIIERASGLPLGTFLEREIFAKAGMRNSVLMDRGAAIPARAYGHDRQDGNWIRRDQSVTSATRGDGAIYSSIDDLARWDASLRSATFTPMVETEPGVSYGFGWFIGKHRDHRLVWHTGETMGFRNAIVRFPDEKVSVVVLTNRNEGKPVEIAKKIADFWLTN